MKKKILTTLVAATLVSALALTGCSIGTKKGLTVNENGNLVNKDGDVVDKKGNLIDEDGNIIVYVDAPKISLNEDVDYIYAKKTTNFRDYVTVECDKEWELETKFIKLGDPEVVTDEVINKYKTMEAEENYVEGDKADGYYRCVITAVDEDGKASKPVSMLVLYDTGLPVIYDNGAPVADMHYDDIYWTISVSTSSNISVYDDFSGFIEFELTAIDSEIDLHSLYAKDDAGNLLQKYVCGDLYL